MFNQKINLVPKFNRKVHKIHQVLIKQKRNPKIKYQLLTIKIFNQKYHLVTLKFNQNVHKIYSVWLIKKKKQKKLQIFYIPMNNFLKKD